MDLDALEERLRTGKKVKFMYLIPNFQNPTGLTTSIEKRKGILELAREFDFLILEDDPYGELWFTGGLDGVRPIKAWDTEGRVVYTSSFSKIISPGIRLAWAVAPAEVIDRFDMARQMMDVCSNPLMQGIAKELCFSGFLDAHIERLRGIYAAQAAAMLAALEKHMPDGVTWTKPNGGFYVWLTLPDRLNALKMLPAALEKNVAYVIGSAFSPNSESNNELRLSFCHENEATLEEGVKRLAEVIKSM
jgi:2-aminoadipate transaminase